MFSNDLVRHDDRPALVLPGSRPVSFAELDARVAAFAAGLGAGKRLLRVEAAPTEAAIVAYLAGLRAGHAVALLPPDDPAALSAFRRGFRPDLIYRRVGGTWRLETADPGPDMPVHPDLALILLTSGSTGQGKAVRLSGAALAANAGAIATFLGLAPDDRAGLVLPLHYSYGLSVLNSHLAAGASIYLPEGGILEPGFITSLVEQRCTNLAGVPYSYDLLESIGFREADLPDLRFMTVAGGRLAPELVRRYHAHLADRGKRFFVMYGQTEATARIAWLPPDLAGRFPDRIGVAIPGGSLALVDADRRPVTRPEVAGELVYRGPNVMMGYALSRDDLARGAEIDVLHTGDLAVQDRHGLYRIVGRLRRLSKIGGRRIGHDELEAALAAQGIAAAVVGDDRSLLAVYDEAVPENRVRAGLSEAARLPLRHVNALAVEALPRLASGKLDYEALRGLLAAHRPPDAEGLAAAFRETFHPLSPAPGDSFASLCGDSLRHVELSLELERHLGHIPDGWEHVPIRELARLERRPAARQTLGTDLVVRAAAIVMVVVQHATLWPIAVGSSAMVVLIGFNLGRFQKDALVTGDLARLLRPLATVLAPYYLIVAGYALAWGTVPWASVFLVGNLGFADPARHTMLPFLYWFVEVFAQLLLVWVVVFLIPGVRRMAARDPFRLGMALLAAAVAARFAVPALWPIGGREIFTLPWILHLAVFGWCAACADTPRKRWLLFAAAATVMPLVAYDGGNWLGSWVRYGAQFAVIAALAFAPRLELPAWLARATLPVAAASLYIYLFHRFAPELLLAPFEPAIPAPAFAVLAVLGGLAVGLLADCARRAARNRAAAGGEWLRARGNCGYPALAARAQPVRAPVSGS